MVRAFEQYLVEVMGIDSMQRDPADAILHPDVKRASAMMFHAGASGTIPTHWNNSPFLSGGRLTSAFGANPKASKKPVLSYQEFIKATKNFQNK